MKRKPEIDRGGRVFLVEGGKVERAIAPHFGCDGCTRNHPSPARCYFRACDNERNGGRGYRILRPVKRGVVS